jgi:hypothetical protein
MSFARQNHPRVLMKQMRPLGPTTSMSSRNALQNTSYLYLIQEREFLHAGTDVVKAGRTSNLLQRMSQYPKSSVALCAFPVADADAAVAEAALLGALRQRFKARRDVGLEYFEGSVPSMVGLAAQVAVGFTSGVQRAARDGGADVFVVDDVREGVHEDVAGEVVDAVREDVHEYVGVGGDANAGIQVSGLDPFLAVSLILDARRDDLSGRTVRAADFYKSALEAGLSRVAYSKFVDLLQRHGVREVAHPFPEGAAAGFTFPRLVPEASSDPWVKSALEFIEAHIDFSPVRPVAGRGKTYFAFITQKDLVARYSEAQVRSGRQVPSATQAKAAVERAMMEGYGRPLQTIRASLGPGEKTRAYDRVSWMQR